MFKRNGWQLLNPEMKESEVSEWAGPGPSPPSPSSPRSISHDSQTLEILIELSTRNIYSGSGGREGGYTYILRLPE